jgi:hypothetical protein
LRGEAMVWIRSSKSPQMNTDKGTPIKASEGKGGKI